MHSIKRMTALCLALLILMMTAASAEVPFLVHTQGWEGSAPVEATLSAKVTKHSPFDDDRLAMLTPITDALSLHLVTGEDAGSVGILLDGEELLTLTYRGNEAQISCVPDTTYQAVDDPLTALLGADTSVDDLYAPLGLNRDGETLITDGRVLLLEGIPVSLADYGTRTASTQSISGYGQATYRYDYVIQASKADELPGLLLQACPDGWLRSIIARLTFSGKQTLRIYYTKEDALLRAEYNGVCGFGDDLRTVTLVYKQLRNDETDKDYLELSSPAKKGKNKTSLTFERTVTTNKKGQRTLEGSYSYTDAAGGITSVRKGEFALNNAFTADADVLTGQMTFQHKLNGAEKYSAVILKPDLTISGTADSPVAEGTITVEETYAGKTTEEAVVSVSLRRAGEVAWEDSFFTVDLSLLNAEEMTALQGEVAASVTTAIVRPLIRKMGAEADWFFREMPEESVQTIVETAGSFESSKEAE